MFSKIPPSLQHAGTLKLLALAMVALAAVLGWLPPEAAAGLALMGEIKLEGLKERLKELQDIATGIQAKADAERRELSAEELEELDKVMAEFDLVEADIQRRERIAAQGARLAAPGQRQTPVEPVNAAPARAANPAATPVANISNAGQRGGLPNTLLTTHAERARMGFNNFGEFALAVRGAFVNPSNMDYRLQNAALSTTSAEGPGADGGFAVPPEWRAEIMRLVDAEDSLLNDTDVQPVSGNNITYPADETSAHQSTGGIQVYWDGETDTITQSKVALKTVDIKLHRLTALVPMTEELLQDAPAMGAYVTSKAGEKFAFKLNDAIVNGTGVGSPLGIMNAPCKVAVAKETSQTDGTVHADNIVKMMARMPAKSFAKATWLINQDVIPQVMKLGFAITTAAGTAAGAGAIYLPPNGLANSSPYGTLFGRPIRVTEACAALGTTGDIILADLSKYLSVVKTGGIKTDVSIHLWFDQNVMAFRFVMRMNGQPWLSSAIARKNGSNTLSHFVALASRP